MNCARSLALGLSLAAALGAPVTAGAWPDAALAPLLWRTRPPALAGDPLAMIDAPRDWSATMTWAPLYAGPHDAAVESDTRRVEVRGVRGAWRGAVALDDEWTITRAGVEPWSAGLERSSGTRATVAVGCTGTRVAWAVGTSAVDGRGGLGATARLALSPLVTTSIACARSPGAGRGDVRWDDVSVTAPGRWTDQALRWALALKGRRGALELGGAALDRAPVGEGDADRLDPALTRREGYALADWRGSGCSWFATASIGAGREGVALSRADVPYARISGPEHDRLVALACDLPGRWPQLRGWLGRSRASARGALALWPFDVAAGMAGTRAVAESQLDLAAAGLAIERAPRTDAGTEGGVALAWLEPRADYASWRASISGLGHDDPGAGSLPIRHVLLAGGRVAGRVLFGRTVVGVEVAQWVPVRVVRTHAAGVAGGPGAAGGAGGNAAATRERGGTMLRLSVEPR